MKNKVHNYPNPDLVETGEKIRALRESRGMSQEQLAELVGVSKNSIHRYENGNVEMKMIIMFKIAFALEVSPYELAPAHYRVRNAGHKLISETAEMMCSFNYDDQSAVYNIAKAISGKYKQ